MDYESGAMLAKIGGGGEREITCFKRGSFFLFVFFMGQVNRFRKKGKCVVGGQSQTAALF